MNEIETLQDKLQRHFPSSWFRLTAPLNSNGQWTLDIRHNARWLVVDWTPPNRFGVSDASDSSLYGEGPDEIYSNSNSALERIEALLTTEERAAPLLPALLSRIREDRNITQAQVAQKLGVAQASVSGMERRKDIQVSTLQRFVEALGGVLEVVARFPDASYVIQTAESTHVGKAPRKPDDSAQTKAARFSFPALARRGSSQSCERIANQTRSRHGVFVVAA